MAKKSLTFYKGTTGTLNPDEGGIVFDNANHVLKVKTSTGYDVYSGVQSVNWNSNTKVLTFVNETNTTITIDFSSMSGLPTVTSADNNKILRVVNGEWTLTLPTIVYTGSTAPTGTLGNNGDIYLQTS